MRYGRYWLVNDFLRLLRVIPGIVSLYTPKPLLSVSAIGLLTIVPMPMV